MNVLRFSLRISSILSFLLLLALGTHAPYRAGISGTVTDAQGSVVSDAKVTVTAKETGVSQQATTDDNGVYSVTHLTSLYRYRGKARLQAGGTRQRASCCRPDESSEPNSIGWRGLRVSYR